MAKEEANSGSASGGNYDVFLSFRGSDTRNTFADCLFIFMRNAGIRIYRDDEELRPGENISEILWAVRSSQIYIPIFSKNYASSRWCLRELTCMVEESYGQLLGKILPIFYDVDPRDVKLDTELYKSALMKHEEELDYTVVKTWKEALTKAAKIKGWHIKDQRQGKVIEDIVTDVLQMIEKRKRELVGIDNYIKDIKKLLNYCDTSDVRFIIIHGIGGIEKTTLAKAVFNQLSPQFEGHSFLSNIQESSSCGDIVKMQRKLVADLFGLPFAKTFNFDEGNNIIKKSISKKRVFLVFDGMDGNDQFLQLAKHCTSCGSGSRIIITARDNSIFSVTKLEESEENISIRSTKVIPYEMKKMPFDHDLGDISREFVKLTGRLPLVIRNQSEAKGKSILKTLEKVFHQDFHQKFKIIPDVVGHQVKQIF
ncbi:hypothetical protein EUGRSUZ_K00852 [Eucalyptus grandis]|uniref:Uncharacterized protein n=2 Tax=Eucalyptus grandis TaxID=71139 RepID=A0ACC3ITP1_EUCGR|nr:hypothetical protein EUGRSUZ_K00852 [Eucalyptus grandis]